MRALFAASEQKLDAVKNYFIEKKYIGRCKIKCDEGAYSMYLIYY